ncbi:hypothetical protein SAMN04487783_1188 [Agrococcus baldri]|uniref:Uncharacterized protein n=1 Tax=Agrococcus baldri TaxID=153730 RepID=A0AA94KZB0_9MICO|nr:hypothetical protein [Agrococcus baldri]SFS08968.1 hypothetical protein SAMN04487783_1188 [Agrococcus baldri]
MNHHTSEPGEHEDEAPESARPVHPDGEVDDPQVQEHIRSSPAEGLGASAAGGAPVHEADSPVDGLGSSAASGSAVREAESPREGLGGAPESAGPSESPERGTGASAHGDERDAER